MNRSGLPGGKDPYIENGYIDKYNDKLYVMKRPGNVLSTDLGVSTGYPQGAFFFNGSAYIVQNDILYVTASGGNTGTDGSAFTQPSVPGWSGRQSFGSAVFNNRIYVIGGQESTTVSDVWSTTDGVTWTNAGSGPFGSLAYPTVCTFNNKLWVIAGVNQNTGTVQNSVWSSPDGTTWTQVTASAAFSPRFDVRVAVTNGGMYLYSGVDATFTPLNDVWFSSDGVTWTKVLATAPWSARHECGACVFQNKMFLIGGGDAGGNALNDVWSSMDGINWTQVTSTAFASGRINMAVTVYNNKIWVIGGQAVGPVFLSDVYSSPDGMVWTLVTNSPGFSARALAQAQVFPVPPTVNPYRYQTIYLMGGTTNGSNFLQDVWYGNINSPLQATYTLSPSVAGQFYQFNTFVNGTYLLIKNSSNMWVLSSGTLIKVVDDNYPAVTVPGIVVLNEYAYVMTPQGLIQACAFNDATTWPATQFIYASYEDDPGVALGKYLNYIVAYGQYTTQFFYDNANPAPGISISPYTNANIRVGCANSSTVQTIENTVIFVGQTSNRNWGVYVLDGMDPKRVSTSWVDRYINQNAGLFSSSMITAFAGHTFYILNAVAGPLPQWALVYDFKFDQWFLWRGTGSTFPFAYAFTDFTTGGDYWVGAGSTSNSGKIYNVDVSRSDDNGFSFPVVIQTDKIDGGTLSRKFWGRLDIVADENNTNMLVEYTDDDYKSYVRWGVVNLNQIRPYINRGGSSRRRAFRFTQNDSNPMRLEAMELNFSAGES